MRKPLGIYLCGPIQGFKYDETVDWRFKAELLLRNEGFEVYSPMYGKEFLDREKPLKPPYPPHPLTVSHAIFMRDLWMVSQCDIILANFVGAKAPSIGSICEIAWGYIFKKFIVIAMEEDNIHIHPFISEAASVIVPSLEDALDMIIKSKPHGGELKLE